MRWITVIGEKTEVQRVSIIWPRRHSQEVVQVGLNPGSLVGSHLRKGIGGCGRRTTFSGSPCCSQNHCNHLTLAIVVNSPGLVSLFLSLTLAIKSL